MRTTALPATASGVALSLRAVALPRDLSARISVDVCEGELTAIAGSPAGDRSDLLAIAAGATAPPAGAVVSGDFGDAPAAKLRDGRALLVPRRLRWRWPAGDRRRVEAALADDPAILFADLAGADAAGAVAAISRWVDAGQRTALVAVADPRDAAEAARVLVLAGGALVADLDRPDRSELAEIAIPRGGPGATARA